MTFFVASDPFDNQLDLDSQEQFSAQHTAGFDLPESEVMSDYGSSQARISMQSGIRSTPVSDFVPMTVLPSSEKGQVRSNASKTPYFIGSPT